MFSQVSVILFREGIGYPGHWVGHMVGYPTPEHGWNLDTLCPPLRY